MIFWVIGVGHAIWDISTTMREKTMERHAELIAQKMAKSEKGQSS
jgi:hypothetical protein